MSQIKDTPSLYRQKFFVFDVHRFPNSSLTYRLYPCCMMFKHFIKDIMSSDDGYLREEIRNKWITVILCLFNECGTLSLEYLKGIFLTEYSSSTKPKPIFLVSVLSSIFFHRARLPIWIVSSFLFSLVPP